MINRSLIFKISHQDSKLDEYDLQEFFEETMDNEFNTKLEDNSAIILSRLVLGYYKLYKNGQLNELSADLAQRFPAKSNNVSSSVRHRDENQMDGDSSSGSDCSDDENNNEEMCEDMNCDPVEEVKTKSKLEEIKESEEFQMVDDGWTFVAKSGKKLTK